MGYQGPGAGGGGLAAGQHGTLNTPGSKSTDPSIVCPTSLHPPLVLSHLCRREPWGQAGLSRILCTSPGAPPRGETCSDPLAPNTPSVHSPHTSPPPRGDRGMPLPRAAGPAGALGRDAARAPSLRTLRAGLPCELPRLWNSSEKPTPAPAAPPPGSGCWAGHVPRGFTTRRVSFRSEPPSQASRSRAQIKQTPLFCTELTSC